MVKGYLILETGETFEGDWITEPCESCGEMVFNTSMTGYQEILTDPSYAGQIITFCYPLIGNYGMNESDQESTRLHARGVIVGETCESPSHYLASSRLETEMRKANIPGLKNVDTRALVQVIRRHGTVYGRITAQKSDVVDQSAFDWETEKKKVDTIEFVSSVSSSEWSVYPNSGPHVVLVDYGFKQSILTSLLDKGCKVTVAPYHITFDQLRSLQPDGVVFSNGPGNPEALDPWFSEVKKISAVYPTLGICLGHQVLALAYGAKTEKLTYGHRGGNHPVKDMQSGKVFVTSQNHGYVIREDSLNATDLTVTFKNVNDGTVEGLRHRHLPIYTVQFHPEAHPGPTDTAYIFEQYINVLQNGVLNYATT